jgi:hypothetical protein
MAVKAVHVRSWSDTNEKPDGSYLVDQVDAEQFSDALKAVIKVRYPRADQVSIEDASQNGGVIVVKFT